MKRSKFIRSLCTLVSIQSESYKTGQMMKHISRVVQSIGGCTAHADEYGNYYVTKGDGPYKAMVCHTDTVHDIVKAQIQPIQIKGNIIAINTKTMTQTGTGGDDKVGIAITLQMLKDQPSFKAVFFLDEEVGCVGSAELDKEFFKDCLYVLECDRRGSKDFVNKISGTTLYNDDFANDIKPILQKHKRTETSGGMTDVLEIAYATDLCVANMSCGYYNPHSDNEYINIEDVIDTYQLCTDIYNTVNNKYIVTEKRESYNWGYPSRYGSYGHNNYMYDAWDYYEDDKETQEMQEKIKTVCGSGCGMTNGYCAACMMSVEDMEEFYFGQDDRYQTKFTPVDQPIQIGPGSKKKSS